MATAEADFFRTRLDRQEDTQKHLNELAAQLSQQAKHRHSRQTKKKRTAQKISRKKKTRRAPSRAHVKYEVGLPPGTPGKSETEEWWFHARAKRVRKWRPRPIDELCAGCSDSGSTADAPTHHRRHHHHHQNSRSPNSHMELLENMANVERPNVRKEGMHGLNLKEDGTLF